MLDIHTWPFPHTAATLTTGNGVRQHNPRQTFRKFLQSNLAMCYWPECIAWPHTGGENKKRNVVAHDCNPRDLGGSGLEDHGARPTGANSSLLNAVTYTVIPSYEARWDHEDSGFRIVRAKKVHETPTQWKKSGCGGSCLSSKGWVEA
jgi:hypothetical protein